MTGPSDYTSSHSWQDVLDVNPTSWLEEGDTSETSPVFPRENVAYKIIKVSCTWFFVGGTDEDAKAKGRTGHVDKTEGFSRANYSSPILRLLAAVSSN